MQTRDVAPRVEDQLRALMLHEAAALDIYQRLLTDSRDPLVGVILAALRRQTADDVSLLRRLASGAFDALEPDFSKCAVAKLRTLAQDARTQASEAQDLADAERALHHDGLALLLETIATDVARQAEVLALLTRAST